MNNPALELYCIDLGRHFDSLWYFGVGKEILSLKLGETQSCRTDVDFHFSETKISN